MKYTIFRLYFSKGLRIGNGRMDTAEMQLPADILFSAMINEVANQDSVKCEKFVDDFKQGKLKISDGLPFIGEEYFLPKPLISNWEDTGDSIEKKAFKKLKYIPLSRWEEFLKGKSNPRELNDSFDSFAVNSLDTKIKYHEDGEHDLYNVAHYRFNKDCGLYFILSYEEEKNYEQFEEMLYNLSFTGIGGKKTSGWGRFEMIEDDLPKFFKDRLNTDGTSMLLTTSMATEKELESVLTKDCNYALMRRGGFIYSENQTALGENTKRKRSMHFFKSGSVFQERFDGDLFNVGKGFVHPVYRYSKPIWLEV